MAALLEIDGLEARYGSSQALFGVSITLDAGSFTSLIGRNGMGKSTTIQCILGLVEASNGRIRFDGTDITGWPSHRIARLGIGLVPEMRQVFPNLSVRENLVATAAPPRPGQPGEAWTLERVYHLFPRLRERAGNLGCNLSGGEQQMLAIGRALMTNPRLLILDEATEGLAPIIRAEIWACLEQLKATGMAILVVDKNLKPLLALADRNFILEKGRVAWQGSSDALRADPTLQAQYLSV